MESFESPAYTKSAVVPAVFHHMKKHLISKPEIMFLHSVK